MFIELVDALRCPVSHEESWLVAAADRTEARHIIEGTLGCPVCKAQFTIHDGVADLRRAHHEPSDAASVPADAGEAVGLAAFLGLDDTPGTVLLLGGWAVHARGLRELVDVNVIAADPPSGMRGEPGISVLRCDGPLPLAPGVARGTAVDATDGGNRIASAVRATRVGGRVVGPVSVPVPAGLRELARDARLWVAEREPNLPIVSLARRR